jgi:hypothetical protein
MKTKTLGLFLVLSLPMINACGSMKYDVKEIKKYQIHMESDDEAVQSRFQKLVEEYNEKVGMETLTYEASAANANSIATLTAGLQNRDGKVGWGQWTKESKQESPFERPIGSRPKRTESYSMQLEFDMDYFLQRMNSDDPEKQLQLYKLFAHEVGHGFQMNHDGEVSSVMYPDISGEKEFEPYYERVRSYFEN